MIARFEQERQALAVMDHSNIAKVLDAGSTDSGRPYFVMELVDGVTVTQFADERCLPLNERLDLFLKVCGAVQHAHQKGIIHRDLKPSNILVASTGDPKVIDFGIAKAIGSEELGRSVFTQQGQPGEGSIPLPNRRGTTERNEEGGTSHSIQSRRNGRGL